MSIRRARRMHGPRGAEAKSLASRFTRVLALVVVVLAGSLALSGSPAAAATGHKFLSQLSEAPPGSPLAAPEAVAVDAATGNAFVSAGEEIDVFDSKGIFKTQFGAGVLEGEVTGIAVDLAGRVYVADVGTNTVDVFKPNGSGGYELLAKWTGAKTPAKAFALAELTGVAVDNSSGPSKGDVYVSEGGTSVVDVFEPQPEKPEEPGFVKTLAGKPELEEVGGVAVSATTGKVYVADTKGGETGLIEVFGSTHVFETKLTGKGAPTSGLGRLGSLAIDDKTGDLYVTDTEVGAADQLNPAGEWIGWLRAAPDGRNLDPTGIALAPSGDVYVSSAATGTVNIFGPDVTVPDVKTGSGKSSKSKPVVVTLTGTINPLGKAKYHFEYGQNGEFTTSTKVEEASGAVELKVSAPVEGLKPGTAYNFRLVAESEEGVPNYGNTVEFITAEAVAGVSTGPPLEVTPTSAKLTGSLEPQKFTTKYYFEWGETTLYGHNSPVPFGVTSATGILPVETKLAGLKPGTTYHYRLVASNQFGISFGGDVQFNTSGPGITVEPATSIGHTTATLNAKINPNKLETKYRFEYGETATYGTTTKEEVLAPGIEKPEPVKAELSGLKLAATYHFRIVATNAAGTVNGPDQEFTTALIESESATALSAETATLQAEISPLGVNTSCEFEYGTSASYGSSVPCTPAPGASNTPVLVSGELKGLTANTTYHYRVTATVEGIAEKGNGRDQTFTTPTTGVAPKLPDGRSYEMVSPPNKQGGYIESMTAFGGAIQSSEDGSSLAYIVNGPIVESPEGNRSPEAQQVLSLRGSTSWANQEITPPHEGAGGLRVGQPFDEYLIFSPDLALSFVVPFPSGLTPLAEPPLSPPLTEAERKPCAESASERPCQEKTMYVRNDAPLTPSTAEEATYNEAKHNGEILAAEHKEAQPKPGYLPLVTAANTPPGTKFGGEQARQGVVNPYMEFLDAAPDLTHAVFLSKVPLTPGAPPVGLYEWGANKLQLVSVLTNGTAATEPGLGLTDENKGSNLRHAISVDGSRVFWTDTAHGQHGAGHLYMRNTVAHTTVAIDVPQEGLPEHEKGEAIFQSASADGSKVFFADTQRLTADSTAGISHPDLYECEIDEAGLACKEGPNKERLKDLTVDPNPGESASVQGQLLGASEDGTYVYFVAKGALAPGATSGSPNLYMVHWDGTKWTTTLVAVLSPEDTPDWFDGKRSAFRLTDQTARVSPNGRYLAFMSSRSLTGYNNIDVNEETGKHADEEVFLYDGEKQHLSCASCNPSGARPRGVFDQFSAGEGGGLLVDRAGTWQLETKEEEVKEELSGHVVDHWLAGSIPGWTSLTITKAIYQSRYLTDTGRLFFTSADPLVPGISVPTRKETIKGKEASGGVGVENVYEYRPNEASGCASASGCVALISNGASDKESAFLDASVTGNDVFLLTAAKLLPQDEDTSYDVYDARVCGEAGCQPPPPPRTSECESIPACRGGSTPAPTFAPPPSFSGPGNTPHKVGVVETLPSKTTKPASTNAQKLAAALKKCRKLPHRTRKQKQKRASCEGQAKKKYGAKKAKHSSVHSTRSRG
jgi:hypothetical protein